MSRFYSSWWLFKSMCVFTMFKLVIKHKYMKKERILKDNLYNRLFHCRQLRRQREKVWDARHVINAAYPFLGALENANDLHQVLEIHRDLWGSGFQNRNLGPDPYGMFRTKDILEMKPEEVYLGNIFGLNTLAIPEWEETREQPYGTNGFGIDPETKTYSLVLDQYRNILTDNVKAIRDKAKEYLAQFNPLG